MNTIVQQVGLDIAEKLFYSEENGSPYDRGGADSYYHRGFDPHWWPLGTGPGTRENQQEMTEYELAAYHAGFTDNEKAGYFK